MICKVRSLRSRIKSRWFLEQIITSSAEVLNDWESDMAVGNRKLGYTTRKTAKSYIIAKYDAGSSIFTPELKAKKNQICETLHAYLWRCIQWQIEKTDRVKLNFGTPQCSSLLCRFLSLKKNCSRSGCAQLSAGDGISSIAFSMIMAADRFCLDLLHSILLRLCTMQDKSSLMFHWHSIQDIVTMLTQALLFRTAANSSIMD